MKSWKNESHIPVIANLLDQQVAYKPNQQLAQSDTPRMPFTQCCRIVLLLLQNTIYRYIIIIINNTYIYIIYILYVYIYIILLHLQNCTYIYIYTYVAYCINKCYAACCVCAIFHRAEAEFHNKFCTSSWVLPMASNLTLL